MKPAAQHMHAHVVAPSCGGRHALRVRWILRGPTFAATHHGRPRARLRGEHGVENRRKRSARFLHGFLHFHRTKIYATTSTNEGNPTRNVWRVGSQQPGRVSGYGNGSAQGVLVVPRVYGFPASLASYRATQNQKAVMSTMTNLVTLLRLSLLVIAHAPRRRLRGFYVRRRSSRTPRLPRLSSGCRVQPLGGTTQPDAKNIINNTQRPRATLLAPGRSTVAPGA